MFPIRIVTASLTATALGLLLQLATSAQYIPSPSPQPDSECVPLEDGTCRTILKTEEQPTGADTDPYRGSGRNTKAFTPPPNDPPTSSQGAGTR